MSLTRRQLLALPIAAVAPKGPRLMPWQAELLKAREIYLGRKNGKSTITAEIAEKYPAFWTSVRIVSTR